MMIVFEAVTITYTAKICVALRTVCVDCFIAFIIFAPAATLIVIMQYPMIISTIFWKLLWVVQQNHPHQNYFHQVSFLQLRLVKIKHYL